MQFPQSIYSSMLISKELFELLIDVSLLFLEHQMFSPVVGKLAQFETLSYFESSPSKKFNHLIEKYEGPLSSEGRFAFLVQTSHSWAVEPYSTKCE